MILRIVTFCLLTAGLWTLAGPIVADSSCRQVTKPVAMATSEAIQHWQERRGIIVGPSAAAALQSEIGAAIVENCGPDKSTPIKSSVVQRAVTNYLDAMIDAPSKTADFASYLRKAEHGNAMMFGKERPFALLKVKLEPVDSDLFINDDVVRHSPEGAYLISPGRVRVRGSKSGFSDCETETTARASVTNEVTCSLVAVFPTITPARPPSAS